MKRKFLIPILSILILPLVSWGPEGHSTTAQIAENHLTAKAKAAMSAILGTKSMSSVSSWADDYRLSHHETGDWHFVNLDTGLTEAQFRQRVLGQHKPNIYKQLDSLIKDLSKPSTPDTSKYKDLKFIIHFVGDAHQPMHVSRKIDLGGNKDTVTYNHHKTNLHKLWDGVLIKDDQPDYKLLATKLDHATKAQILKWQSDAILTWLYESYQISTKLYSEAPNHAVLPANYYSTHISIAEQRLEKGGIRLAGILNSIFK